MVMKSGGSEWASDGNSSWSVKILLQNLLIDYNRSLAFLGHFDFIYSMPNAWLSVPFTFLGPLICSIYLFEYSSETFFQ
jgi:hypothetical protein